MTNDYRRRPCESDDEYRKRCRAQRPGESDVEHVARVEKTERAAQRKKKQRGAEPKGAEAKKIRRIYAAKPSGRHVGHSAIGLLNPQRVPQVSHVGQKTSIYTLYGEPIDMTGSPSIQACDHVSVVAEEAPVHPQSDLSQCDTFCGFVTQHGLPPPGGFEEPPREEPAGAREAVTDLSQTGPVDDGNDLFQSVSKSNEVGVAGDSSVMLDVSLRRQVLLDELARLDATQAPFAEPTPPSLPPEPEEEPYVEQGPLAAGWILRMSDAYVFSMQRALEPVADDDLAILGETYEHAVRIAEEDAFPLWAHWVDKFSLEEVPPDEKSARHFMNRIHEFFRVPLPPLRSRMTALQAENRMRTRNGLPERDQ